MKLHLPLSLRSALLAACALVGFSTAGARDAYWIDANGQRHDIDQKVMSLDIENAESFVVQNTITHWEYDDYHNDYGGAIYVGRGRYTDDYWNGSESWKDWVNSGAGDLLGKEIVSAKKVTISGNKTYGDHIVEGGALTIDHMGLEDDSLNNPQLRYFSFAGCGEITVTNNGAHSKSYNYGYDESYVPDYDESYESDRDLFWRNMNAWGGAIELIGNNGTSLVQDSYYGTYGQMLERRSVLEFKNNSHVYIRGNYINTDDLYCMNAIETTDADLTFAATEGNKIECYDALLVDGTLWINTTHPGLRDGQESSYTGTVLLSGEYVAQDLTQLKDGKAPTEEELKYSRTVYTEAVHVEYGVLELKEMELASTYDLEFSAVEHKALFYSSANAEVRMTNATLHTEWGWNNAYWHYETEYEIQFGTVIMPNATFTGTNTIRANYINANDGVWTFNVAAENATKAILTIESDSVYEYDHLISNTERALRTETTTFVINLEDGLESGRYKLMELSPYTYWDQSFTLDETADGKLIYTTSDDGTFTLWYKYSINTPVTRPATTLTWAVDSGEWTEAEGTGEWSGSVDDKRFHTGDSVVFNKESNVVVRGEVLPADILVNNEEGYVTLQGADEESTITGDTGLTKKGEGTLVVNMNNAYTGDTIIQAGTVITKARYALGLGTVQLQGGTLDLNNWFLDSDIRATGKATLLGADWYDGKLTLDGGTLDGDAIKIGLWKDATLISGSMSNDVIGSGQMIKSGTGTVTLSGNLSNSGGLDVQEGTLALRGSEVNGSDITVQTGATLSMKGVSLVSGLLTLHTGATAKVEDVLTLHADSTLMTMEEQTIVGGRLELAGGTLNLGGTLTVEGSVSATDTVTVYLNTQKLFEEETLVILKANDLAGLDADTLYFPELQNTRASAHKEGAAISVHLNKQDLIWQPGSAGNWGMLENGAVWNAAEDIDPHFYNLDAVVFECGAGERNEVNIIETVEPGSISVRGAGDTIFKGEGQITGSAKFTKEGAGTLEINTDNSNYSGNIEVKEGTLRLGHDNALGSGSAVLIRSGATFDGNDHCIYGAREISMYGESTLKRASNISRIRFESGAKVSGDKFTLRHNLTIGAEGAEFTGDFHFAQNGQLTLTGGKFTISGKVTHDEPITYNYGDYTDMYAGRAWYDDYIDSGEITSPVTTIDVTGWEGITYGGDYELISLELEDGADVNKLFTVIFDSNDGANQWMMMQSSELEYKDGSIWLHIHMMDWPEEFTETLSGNQAAVSDALHSIIRNQELTGSKELSDIYREFSENVKAEDYAAARAILDQLSGAELATAMTSQLEGNMAHLRRLRSNMGSGQRLDDEGKNTAYILGYDGQNHVDADAGKPGIKRTEWGGTVGYERFVGEKAIFGFALTGGSATVRPTGGESYDEDALRLDFYSVANYDNGWRNIFSLGFGQHEFSITRRLPGGYTASSSPKGYSLNFQDEVAYTRQISEQSSIQPFASIEVSANVIPAFSESGAGSASLESHDCATSAVDITLGARYIRSFRAGERTGHVSVQAAIVMSQGESATDMELHFAGAPDRRFKVGAASTDSMGFNLGASVLYPITKHAAVTASASAILRGGSEETGASVGLRLSF